MKKTLIGHLIVLVVNFSIFTVGLDLFQRVPNLTVSAKKTMFSDTVIELKTAADLFKIQGNRYSRIIFRLTNDIDLATDDSWHCQVGDWQICGWLPLDTYGMTECLLDGDGYTFWNLHITRAETYSGLFSINSLKIRNLFFEFTDIKGGQKSGTLAGLNYGTVENVHIKGSVDARVSACGVVAENFGDIDNCSFDGALKGRTVDGLIAENSCAVLSNSCSQGSLKVHFAGGLIWVSAGVESEEIKTSFSSAEVIAESYDSTPLRTAGFIAVKYETVTIESCYSLNGTIDVASGDFEGTNTLSPAQFLQAKNLIGFDFDNYWTYATGMLEQRTLAVSTNEQYMSGIAVKIIGARKYYLPQKNAILRLDNAILRLDAGCKPSIGIKSIVVDDVERKADFINGNWAFGSIAIQINIAVETWYLIKIEINSLAYGEILKLEKNHFASNEKIVLLAKKMDEYDKPMLTAALFGQAVSFDNAMPNADVANGYYRFSVDWGSSSYSESSLLFVDIHYVPLETEAAFPVCWIVIICVAGAGVVAAGVFIIIKLIRRKMNERSI
ncbi:MAG: hypothetical protein LBE09_07425 [Christensenellaceae bacterium]|jgi:hypothetical protein|nr:hypothetical protein [Christensenellaceae bacterium]